VETRKIGSLDVSVVGLGCNNFGRRLDAAGTATVVDAAIDAGINFFDTADIYGNGQSEEYIAGALKGRRDKIILATKFGNAMEGQGKGASAQYIPIAVDASLRRLNTDYIDLYQLHNHDDMETPIAETLGALDELVKAGKVREIGASNFSAAQVREAEEAVKHGSARFVSLQNEYNMLKRDDEREVLPECERLNIAYLPYFPLASGLLTGKYRQNQPLPQGTRISNNPQPSRWLNDENLAVVDKLIEFSESRGHSILELAFSWLLARPIVASVIAGAMTADQIHANVGAASWKLTSADLSEIDTILAG
jgi:aryl-alcohol dehydrogenase-like predicted oxidoreductase